MKQKHVATIIVAVIGAVGTIGGSYCSAKWGQSNFQITVNTSSGDGVEVNKENVQTIVSESEGLKKENSDYKSKVAELEAKNEDLSKKLDSASGELNDLPSVEFRDMGLSIDGDEQVVSKSKSCATINGETYFADDFINCLIGDGKSATIKNDMMYIGKIVSEQEFLSGQWVIDSSGVETNEKVVDSYGNNYTGAFLFTDSDSSIAIRLNKKFSMLKAKVAIEEKMESDQEGHLEILADGIKVYESPKLTLMTEAFDIDIPINNANVLTINYISEYGSVDCIIADAVVYN